MVFFPVGTHMKLKIFQFAQLLLKVQEKVRNIIKKKDKNKEKKNTKKHQKKQDKCTHTTF